MCVFEHRGTCNVMNFTSFLVYSDFIQKNFMMTIEYILIQTRKKTVWKCFDRYNSKLIGFYGYGNFRSYYFSDSSSHWNEKLQWIVCNFIYEYLFS